MLPIGLRGAVNVAYLPSTTCAECVVSVRDFDRLISTCTVMIPLEYTGRYNTVYKVIHRTGAQKYELITGTYPV